MKFVCPVCGYVYEGDSAPEKCPQCGVPGSKFTVVDDNGGKLVLTTEQFFTPSGKIIHQNGVTPDICEAKNADGSCKQESRLWEEHDIETAIKLLKNEI